MYRFLMVVFLIFLFPFRVSAVDLNKLSFHGFSFVTLTKENGKASNGVERGHTWFVAFVPLDSTLTLVTIVSPEGPPRLLHNLHVVWKPRTRAFSAITAGKFIPPFGKEFWILRIDQTETVYYAKPVDAARFVARDTGVQASGVAGALRWDAAVFTGDRTGGGFPVSEKGNPDYYFRLRVPFGNGVQIGASQRFGPIPASALDASVRWKLFSLEAEGVRVKKELDYFALAVIRLPGRTALLYRYEDFLDQSYHTYGGSFRLNDFVWVKVNFANGPDPFRAVGQFVVQW